MYRSAREFMNSARRLTSVDPVLSLARVPFASFASFAVQGLVKSMNQLLAVLARVVEPDLRPTLHREL